MRLNIIVSLLFALAVGFFVFAASPPNATAATKKQTVEQTTATDAAPMTIAPAIVEEIGICNVADRVTATVARLDLNRDAEIIPEAPVFGIMHVPLS